MIRSFKSVALALTAVAVGAAGLMPASPARAQEEIPVGILLPLSGSVAPIGINNRRGHELAVEEINAAGGIKSLGGASIQMTMERYGHLFPSPDYQNAMVMVEQRVFG